MHKYLEVISSGPIDPPAVTGGMSVADLVDQTFQAYNAARLREACQLVVEHMLGPDCAVGVSISGALTPAGLGRSCLAPLMRAGFVDWIVSTGANLYHDAHYSLGLPMFRSRPNLDDRELQREQVTRIYDIVFDYRTLLDTDAFFRSVVQQAEFQKTFSTAELHHLLGRYLVQRERELTGGIRSTLAVAHDTGVPVFTSAPGDSSIALNLAAWHLEGGGLRIDPLLDVNLTSAIVHDIKESGGQSAVIMLGGGSPKNFLLQTEPHIQEVLGLQDSGHDYFLQITDARPDTGGLSGATPSEAVTWNKLDAEKLSETVIVYCDTTIALPILTTYCLARKKPRPLRRLYDRLPAMLERLRRDYEKRRGA